MRVKSEARRQAILDVAAEVFCEQGFEQTSMSEITARVGGSKATLYSYFPSKEALFVEVMQRFGKAHIDGMFAELDPDQDLRESLCKFGEQFVAFLSQPKGGGSQVDRTLPMEYLVCGMTLAALLTSGFFTEPWLHLTEVASERAAARFVQ